MKIVVLKTDGTKARGKIDLNPGIYEIEPHDHVISQAVRAELSNLRQGTHKAKTRAEVRGGGRKPWRQKGRGTARSGSTRSPIWVGGGKAFGPTPHLYKLKLNKKVKKLARRSALSYKAKDNQLIVVDSFQMETSKTKDFAAFLANLKVADKKVTILLKEVSENLYLASRNIPNVYILEVNNASTYDIMDCETLIMDKDAVEILNSLLEV